MIEMAFNKELNKNLLLRSVIYGTTLIRVLNFWLVVFIIGFVWFWNFKLLYIILPKNFCSASAYKISLLNLTDSLVSLFPIKYWHFPSLGPCDSYNVLPYNSFNVFEIALNWLKWIIISKVANINFLYQMENVVNKNIELKGTYNWPLWHCQAYFAAFTETITYINSLKWFREIALN